MQRNSSTPDLSAETQNGTAEVQLTLGTTLEVYLEARFV